MPGYSNVTGYKERASALFQQIDRNRSGRISDSELRAAFPSVQAHLLWPGTAEQLLSLLAPNGGISLETLTKYFEVVELFKAIDDNSSGRINLYELKLALTKNRLVQQKLCVPPGLAPTLFSQIDTDGSGSISLIEFYRHYTAAPLSKPFKPLGDYTAITNELFKRIDVDRSGSISKKEFCDALSKDREIQLELGWPAHMAEHLFTFLDSDRSGDVSSTEFRTFCKAQWLFNNIDDNRSGYIDAYELGVALAAPSMQEALGVAAHNARDTFREMDKDGSGVVKFSEFYNWLARHPSKSKTVTVKVPESKADQFKDLKKIGEGAFGAVFLCEKYTGERVIKKIPKAEAGESSEEFKERMKSVEQEAKMLHQYKHPNIVRYCDSYWQLVDGRQMIIIITEYCGGGDLRGYQKKRGGKLEPRVAKDLFSQTCKAIEFLHKGRLLHRDLKPDNIFLAGRDDRPIVKIGDFGLVKQLGKKTAVAVTFCGTMNYMAPEILSGSAYGMPNDVWALGCIFYEMAIGKLAFGNAADIVRHNRPTDCPSWCSHIVYGILNENAGARPSVSKALQDVLALRI